MRLSLKSGKRLKEGLDHDSGNALLYVHIDMEHRYPNVALNKRKERAPLLALGQLPRIRTLFLKADPEDDEMDVNEDAGAYAWALGDQSAPELQDLTFGWLGEEKLELEFIKQPFPRLRYLALMGCDLTSHQTILRTDNLVQANFWDVYLFETIDELVDTFSRWKCLQYVNISNCCLIGSGSKVTKYERRAAYLPALKEITFFDNTADIGTFLTYIAFPPTVRADVCFNASLPTPELTRIVGDAIHDHFDSPEGRSMIANAHALVISYPNGYEIQSRPSETARYWLGGVVSDGKPEARFLFHQNGAKAQFLEENLARFPALEMVSRLDLSQKDHFHPGPPPPHILRRFSGATQLVLNQDCQSVLDDIPKDAKLLPQLESLELFTFTLQGKHHIADMRKTLEAARKARPSLAGLVLRGCKMGGETFESVFGKGKVQMEDIPKH